MRRAAVAVVASLVAFVSGCGAFRAEMQQSAVAQAVEDLGVSCGPLKVVTLNDWSFRAENACGEVAYYRCGTHRGTRAPAGRHFGLSHFDCHAHASEEEVVGLFHPYDGPGEQARRTIR